MECPMDALVNYGIIVCAEVSLKRHGGINNNRTRKDVFLYLTPLVIVIQLCIRLTEIYLSKDGHVFRYTMP